MQTSQPPHAKPTLDDQQVLQLFAALEESRPDPVSELHYRNPYTLLVAVVLSAQTTDVGVNKATRVLFPIADTPRKMLQLGEEGLRGYIRTIGLWNTKARNIISLSRILLEKHDGQVPANREALQALPGVGRKTANVVLNAAFHLPTIAVDTHVFRVANRTGLTAETKILMVEQKLEDKTPEKYKQRAHHWLVLHGRYVCKARRPLCTNCVIRKICLWPEKV